MNTNVRPGWLSLGVVAVTATTLGLVLAGSLQITPWTAAERSAGEPQSRPVAAATAPVPAPPAGYPDFATLADQVIPSIISVFTERTVETRPMMDPFEFFFGPSRPFSQPQRRRAQGAGSGFFISAEGLALTNNHVIEGVDTITVRLADETELPASVVGRDPATDLALIQVENGGPFTPLVLGDSDALRVGEWVMAVGNPLRMSHTVTVGVVSAKGRVLGLSEATRSFENFIQTDAAINMGNSGGPLVNLRGEAIGINTAISAAGQNIGFAVPVNHAKAILPQLKERGRVVRGYLGVEINDPTEDEKEAFKLPSRAGSLVHMLVEDGPAEKAGMKPGDFITAVDGRKIANTQELVELIASRPPSAKVDIEVFRDGKRLTLTAELAERPGAPLIRPDDDPLSLIGLQVEELTRRLRQSMRLRESVRGVVITDVALDSPADEARLQPGLIITQANGQDIATVDELANVIGAVEPGSRIRLYVLDSRTGRRAFYVLRMP